MIEDGKLIRVTPIGGNDWCVGVSKDLVKKRAEYWKDYLTVFIDVHRRRFSDIKRGDGECLK